jgi:hypothetical protein
VEAFPDLAQLSDAELKRLTEEKMADERDVSLRRRQLHARIDLLRSEHTRRLKERQGAIDVDPAAVSAELLAQRPEELAVLADDDLLPTSDASMCAARASARSRSSGASSTARSTCCAPRSWLACASATGRRRST